jgi:ABC-type lipoprotein release transport system permease subunit
MVIGLALLIFSRSLSDGGHEQWIDSAVRLGTGHIAIQAPEYLETGKLDHRLDSARASRAASAVENVLAQQALAWAPRLSVNGLASSAASALPARIIGVDPEREARFSDIDEKVQDGRYLGPEDRLHAYVGVELARRLELRVGSRFVLTGQSATGDIEGQLVRVAGIFRTAIPEIDEGLIHVPIWTVREWLRTPGAVTTVATLLASSRMTTPAASSLEEELSTESGIRVLGWQEAAPELESAIRLDDYGDYVFHIILFAIVALAILNAVIMSVLGRRREFGLLQALGLTAGETGWVVFGEGLLLTALSGVVGIALGYLFTWVFFRDGLDFSGLIENEMSFSGGIMEPVIVPVFYLKHVLISVYFILIIGTLASIYPAIRASRLDPAEAVKVEQ